MTCGTRLGHRRREKLNAGRSFPIKMAANNNTESEVKLVCRDVRSTAKETEIGYPSQGGIPQPAEEVHAGGLECLAIIT